ncbi:MAG: MliC family protein [Pseudomonadota bacterium]
MVPVFRSPLRRILVPGLLLGLGLVLAACSGEEEEQRDSSQDVVTYTCAEGQAFQVFVFAANPIVRVTLDGTSYELRQVPSDLGVTFSNGEVQLTILLDRASLTGTPRGDLLDCAEGGDGLFS